MIGPGHDITTLIFDWDGTLVDSAQLGLAAFEKTFSELGFPFAHAVYEETYSPNWYCTYEALGLPKELYPRKIRSLNQPKPLIPAEDAQDV